jgi:hypothetical protein
LRGRFDYSQSAQYTESDGSGRAMSNSAVRGADVGEGIGRFYKGRQPIEQEASRLREATSNRITIVNRTTYGVNIDM